jgi:quinol monooxygenase YgiN
MNIARTLLLAACFAATTTGQAQAQTPTQAHTKATAAASASAKVGLYVLLHAKPGKEEDVANFLLGGKALVDAEPATSSWFAIRLDPTTFGIFDTFPNQAGRDAHLAGKVAAALMAKAPELLASPPSIEKVDVLAAKLPGQK